MATHYLQDGDVLNFTAPYAVASGGGFLVGSLFAVALSAAASGASKLQPSPAVPQSSDRQIPSRKAQHTRDGPAVLLPFAAMIG